MKRLVLFGFLGIVAVTSSEAQEIRFTKSDTRVNDTSRQWLQCHLAAERTIRHQNQLVDSSKQSLERRQDRVVRILNVERGLPVRALLRYGASTTRVGAQDNQTMEVTQPIAGNAYIVTRSGSGISITDEVGQPITDEENKLLRVHLETFGKPNPLAQFLDGKRIAVGQSIIVPDAVARELLGLTGNAGKTDKLSLRLAAVKRIEQVECAVFETLLRTHGEETTMSLLMKGELLVETNSCRTREINLQGPIAVSEARGPAEGRFVISTNGTLQVNVQTAFGQPATRLGSREGQRR